MSWNNFKGSGKMPWVLGKSNSGFRKSALQSVSTVYRSSRMDKPVITYHLKTSWCIFMKGDSVLHPPKNVTGWKICMNSANAAHWIWKADSVEWVALAKHFRESTSGKHMVFFSIKTQCFYFVGKLIRGVKMLRRWQWNASV